VERGNDAARRERTRGKTVVVVGGTTGSVGPEAPDVLAAKRRGVN
jgi:hypothetical protein